MNPDTIKDLTVDKLKKLAKKAGIKRYSSMRKKELVRVVRKSIKDKKRDSSKKSKRDLSKRDSSKKSKRDSSKKRSGTKKERLLKETRKSPRKSPNGTKRVNKIYKGKSNLINSFFDRIFIINLADKTERFNKVTKQFHKHGVKYMRFNALDGRCKEDECKTKKKEFESKYKIKISNKVKVPVASLVLGTIQILKEQVRNKWDTVLICEDDVVFDKNIMKKFSKGIVDMPPNWDLLYLGCGNQCGHKGISEKKTSTNRHKTSLSVISKDYDWFVHHKDDLRTPCSKEECPPVDNSKYLSYPASPGGGWAYCYSLSGAKKFLKFIGNTIKDHVDQLLIKAVEQGRMTAVSFDPPIIWHEEGALRPDSDLPWDW